MKFIYNIYDRLRWILVGKKPYNHEWIELARPSEVVNIEVGMTVTAVHRSVGAITFSYKDPRTEFKRPLGMQKSGSEKYLYRKQPYVEKFTKLSLIQRLKKEIR